MAQLEACETQQTPLLVNQVEAAVNEQFNDPALWSSKRPTRMRAGTLAGLERVAYYDTAYNIGEQPSRHWVTLLYGSRVLAQDTAYSWSRAEFETTSLETMTDIHAHLARTVLAGEDVRPSVLVDPPVASPSAMGRDRANNIFWLAEIIRGVWPIMSMQETEAGQKVYFGHDYSDYHNALAMLLPRETQTLITQVAKHELAWVLRHEAGEVGRDLSLRGDTEMGPLGLVLSGQRSRPNGMHIIDELTEEASYVRLLHYLMHGEGATPEDRLAAAQAHNMTTTYNTPINNATVGLKMMRRHTGAMVNFISRHSHRRNTTPAAVDAEYEKFKQGSVRMAKNILGEYDPALEPQPSNPSQNTNMAQAAGSLVRRLLQRVNYH